MSIDPRLVLDLIVPGMLASRGALMTVKWRKTKWLVLEIQLEKK